MARCWWWSTNPRRSELPHTLRPVDVGDEALAEFEVLVGFNDDLASEAIRLGNRNRGLLTRIHPALERAIGPKISHPAVHAVRPGQDHPPVPADS